MGGIPVTRRVARWAGELALIWLLAAATAASFLPRGVGLNTQDQLQITTPGTFSGLLIAIPAAGLCAGLWWLLTNSYYLPLAVAATGLLVAALLLPRGLPVFFLPSPLVLLASAWVLRWAPPDPDDAPGGRPPDG